MKPSTLIIGALATLAAAAPQGAGAPPAKAVAAPPAANANEAAPPAENVDAGNQDQNAEANVQEENAEEAPPAEAVAEAPPAVDVGEGEQEEEDNNNEQEGDNNNDREGDNNNDREDDNNNDRDDNNDDDNKAQFAKAIDIGAFNGFAFANDDLKYLNAINDFELQAFVNLAAFNGLNIDAFQAVFVNDVFDINAIIQIQQVALLSHLGSLGVFNNIDPSVVDLNVFELGALGGIGGFDVASLKNQAVVTQVQTVVQTSQLKAIIV